ncbi:MAG: hypothetical protein Kow009_04540 [Spirochaetales bacterium]
MSSWGNVDDPHATFLPYTQKYTQAGRFFKVNSMRELSYGTYPKGLLLFQAPDPDS